MAVQVEEVMPAKSGKSLRVKLGGTWYGANLDSGLNGAKGQMIEAEIQTSDKFGPWIKGWRPSAAPQVPSQAAPLTAPAAAAPYKYAEPSDNSSPWWAPFMSNMCAHAIQAGLCKAPEQLNQWALKAAQVAVAVREEVKK